MMDQGYFVPKSEILSWLNDLLHVLCLIIQLNLTKIEQLGAGSVYSQVIDVIHPGTVAMSKLNWKAKNDYEFISNLKILQNAFAKVGIKRYIEVKFGLKQVEKLARAKYQDNLEFIQWLKRYYDKNCGDRGANYNPEERRGKVQIDFGFAEKNVVPKTYNGTGVVIPNTSVVVEKPVTTSKKQDIPKEQIQPNKIKSPTVTSSKNLKEATNKVAPINSSRKPSANHISSSKKVESNPQDK